MISYKYNIYHSKKTKYLDKMLRECCFVWNHALALQRRYYKLFGKYISVGKMKKHFTKLCAMLKWAKEKGLTIEELSI